MSVRALPALAACGLAALLGACMPATQRSPTSAPPASAPAIPGLAELTPYPASVELHAGSFAVPGHGRVVIARGDDAARGIAQLLVGWAARSGISLTLDEGGAPVGAIALLRDAQAPPGEAYALDVDASGIRATAADAHGLFNAAVSVYQLLSAASVGKTVPAMHVADAPAFAWRGLMLDSVRHFQSPDEVRTLIDQMALLKLDVFHWHLTDDQGWRLQIRKYPQLTTIGSCREAVGVDIGITGGAHKPYCGFYTQDDVRDIVKYAAARYITVVPEIEMPGHAQASIAALPWLGSTGKRPKVSSDWGVNPYLYNSTDRTFSFMQNVLDEVMELFPSSYIHVGGDEAIKDQWQASKAVQAKMHQLGFTHEEQLQGWFIARIGAYLDEHGRRLIGWDEILDGDVPASAAVMSWRGTEGAVKAAAKGHDVVLAPAPLLYMGQVQSHRHDESQGRMPVVTLKDLYDFKVVPDGIAASNAAHVLGAEVTIFAEQTPTFRDVQHAVFPRLTALAERTWTAKPDWPSFLARMPAEMDRLRASGIDAADTAFAVAIDASYKRGKATVALSTQVDQGTIRYTTDGSTPSLASPAYTAPFDVNLPVTVTAANFVDGAPIAKPRSLAIDTMALSRRPSDALALCSGRDGSRQQAVSRSNGTYAVHYVDIMDTCWQWKGADLTGVTGITVDVDHLPWNFQLAHEAKGVVSRPRHSRRGEVEVHLDTCNGPLLARMPLPAAKSTLKGTWPSVQGTHDICIAATGKPGPMLWVLGDVQLTR